MCFRQTAGAKLTRLVEGRLRRVSWTLTVITALTSCSGIPYPTATSVDQAILELPSLETINQGRAYISVVRNSIVEKRDRLQGLQIGLDTGVLAGVVATGLGTALKWGTPTNTKLAIFSAALLGADSALSIPQQVQILNKGLDALICVETQAEADWLPLREQDVPLELVASDINLLTQSLDQAAKEKRKAPLDPGTAALQDAISSGTETLIGAQLWLDQASVPIADVNSGVKIGADQVLQTTVDQLSTELPDASAFSRISSAFPLQTTSVAPPTYTDLTSKTPQDVIGTPSPEVQVALAVLNNAISTTKNDIAGATSAVSSSVTTTVTTLPVVNCPLTGATSALASTPSVIQLTASSDGPLDRMKSITVTAAGGMPPYTPRLAAENPGPNVHDIEISSNMAADKTTYVLSAKQNLTPGTVDFLVSDTKNTMAVVRITTDAK